MRCTFKTVFYVNGSKERNGIVPIMGRVTINGTIAQFSCKQSVTKAIWDAKGNRAIGKSKEAKEVNFALDNIKAQIAKHYQRLSDREAFVTAEMVRNAYQGIGTEYETLLRAFDKENAAFAKRVGKDRAKNTYNKYLVVRKYVAEFIKYQYKRSDMSMNELTEEFIRDYCLYLKSNSRRVSKDDLFTLTEFALVCLEELEEMTSAQVSQLKAITGMTDVNERAAYGHFKESRPHIASFCGTSNNVTFLNDLSGNRRWLPFEVDSIDSPFDYPIDYAGVYAQGYALWKSGFHYWFEQEEIDAVNLHNRYFEVPCLERELVQVYYRRPMPGEECMFLTNAQILGHINIGIRQPLSPTRLGLVMKQEGYEAVRSGGRRGYRVVELKGDEIYRNQCAMARYVGD